VIQGNWLALQPDGHSFQGAFEFSGSTLEKTSLQKPLVFDLASLSKVLLTSTLLIDLMEREYENDWGRFLDLNLRDELPEIALLPDWVDLKLRSLWEHRSGLPPHFYLSGGADQRMKFEGPRQAQWKRVAGKICEELRTAPAQNGETRYSDVGFWPLGLFLENRSGKTLQELWSDWKKRHQLPADDLVFASELRGPVVPTETRHPAGEVNDDNSYWMHSVAPHAGLFGTVSGVEKWIQEIARWTKKNPSLKFWTHRQESSKSRFWLGWDTASGEIDSQAGSHFASKEVLGHLGWTGTAFWWNPDRNAYGILLTNRTYPVHDAKSQDWIRSLRREFFSDVWQSKAGDRWGS
jgi:serine-type D-Ala-D-Ala carboxypeptidase